MEGRLGIERRSSKEMALRTTIPGEEDRRRPGPERRGACQEGHGKRETRECWRGTKVQGTGGMETIGDEKV